MVGIVDMNIIGTGLTGLVGTKVTEILSPEFNFINLSLESGIDITDYKKIREAISRTESPWLLHFAAFTNVDEAEKDRTNGHDGKVWKINVTATENLVNICKTTQKKLLYISTDFVFDGKKDIYDEEDVPNPIGWYGITKYAGEKAVQNLKNNGLIVRISYPYRSFWSGKPDFVQKIVTRLKSGQIINSPNNQLIVPTLIDDIAEAIRNLIQNNATGIYHVVGSSALSPFQAAVDISKAFSFPDNQIIPVTAQDYYLDQAPRPLRTYLSNGKITKYGIKMNGFSDGLIKIKNQMKGNIL